jgi:hypothetical protein
MSSNLGSWRSIPANTGSLSAENADTKRVVSRAELKASINDAKALVHHSGLGWKNVLESLGLTTEYEKRLDLTRKELDNTLEQIRLFAKENYVLSSKMLKDRLAEKVGEMEEPEDFLKEWSLGKPRTEKITLSQLLSGTNATNAMKELYLQLSVPKLSEVKEVSNNDN